jgi:Rieske Fe-S protein
MPETTIDHADEHPDPPCHHLATGCVDRRWLLRGGAGLAAGAALVACGADGGASPTDTDDSDPDDGGDSGGGDEPTGGGDATLTTTANVPVGGGTIVSDAGVVVTQPVDGEFKAFSSECTHQGCQVTDVTETINCSCHGSQFSLEDGSPVAGPAPSALADVQINIKGDQIALA